MSKIHSERNDSQGRRWDYASSRAASGSFYDRPLSVGIVSTSIEKWSEAPGGARDEVMQNGCGFQVISSSVTQLI